MLLFDLAVALLAANGPFAKLDDYCRRALWEGEKPQLCRVTDRIDDVRIPAMKGTSSTFRQLAWIQIGRSNIGEYSLAIRGDAGWFVVEMPLFYSNRGRGYSRVNSVAVQNGMMIIRTTSADWCKPLTDAEMEDADPDHFYDVGWVTFCGVGTSGRISCLPEFISAAKVDRPDDPDAFDFDAFRNPAWELTWRFEGDGVTFAASKTPPPRVWGRNKLPEEAKRIPGHHPLRFP